MSKKFIASNPVYCVVAGANNAAISDIEKAVRGTFAAARKMGRNPVLVGVNDNAVSIAAQAVAEDQKVPIMFGTVADITKDLDGRRLRKDHIQVILFQTPEYAGSDEAYELLCGCRQFHGTLRMYSVFHGAWLGSKWNKAWVREFNDRFLNTLNSYSMSAEDKKALFAERMLKIQKYPTNALFERKQSIQPSTPQKAPELPQGIPFPVSMVPPSVV